MFKFIILSLFCLSSISFGGMRPVELHLVNVTEAPLNKEGKRLFELIERDIRLIINDPKNSFGWETSEHEENASTVKTIDPSLVKGAFSPLTILKDKKKLQSVIDSLGASDGIITFEYDLKGMNLRLKHFDYETKESILIRIPLNKGGSMNLSVYKFKRQGALIALASSIDFNP